MRRRHFLVPTHEIQGTMIVIVVVAVFVVILVVVWVVFVVAVVTSRPGCSVATFKYRKDSYFESFWLPFDFELVT